MESHLDLSAQDLEFGFNETRRDRILRTYVRNNFHYHLNEIFAVLKVSISFSNVFPDIVFATACFVTRMNTLTGKRPYEAH